MSVVTCWLVCLCLRYLPLHAVIVNWPRHATLSFTSYTIAIDVSITPLLRKRPLLLGARD